LWNLEAQNQDLMQQLLEAAQKTDSRVTSLEVECRRLMKENVTLKLEASRLEDSIKSEHEDSAKDARMRLENLLASVTKLSAPLKECHLIRAYSYLVSILGYTHKIRK
jgi:regulator of replication initiation timing